MNWFRKIFDFKNQNPEKEETSSKQLRTNLSEIDTLNVVKEFLSKYNKESYLFNPLTSENDSEITESKFGGIPNLKNFDQYPKCESCQTNLNFVLQIYKNKYNEQFFPNQTDLFQVFRCPNRSCEDSYNQFYDLPTKLYFFKNDTRATQIEKPRIPISDNHEAEVPTCIIQGKLVNDLPHYDEHDSDINSRLDKIYGNDGSEYFIENYQPTIGTKMGGYPTWIQGYNAVRCQCGNYKEFIFQLSSEEREEGSTNPPLNDKWSPHKIMIGDVGNLYFFMCKSCGLESIESNWDCF